MDKKLLVGVIVKDKFELYKFYKLFKFLLKDKIVEIQEGNIYCAIITNDVYLKFSMISPSLLSQRFHYVINLTDDDAWWSLAVSPDQLREFLEIDERFKELL